MTQIEITDWSYWSSARAWAGAGARARARARAWTARVWPGAGARARDYKLVALGDMIHDE